MFTVIRSYNDDDKSFRNLLRAFDSGWSIVNSSAYIPREVNADGLVVRPGYIEYILYKGNMSEPVEEKGISLDELFNWLESNDETGTYIVRIRYKYDHEKEYRYTNEVLTYDNNHNLWEWLNDWNEVEDDVSVVAYKSIEDIL